MSDLNLLSLINLFSTPIMQALKSSIFILVVQSLSTIVIVRTIPPGVFDFKSFMSILNLASGFSYMSENKSRKDIFNEIYPPCESLN